MYLNNFLSQNQNNRWGFFCILLYGLLVGFQGFDLCDEGWTMPAGWPKEPGNSICRRRRTARPRTVICHGSIWCCCGVTRLSTTSTAIRNTWIYSSAGWIGRAGTHGMPPGCFTTTGRGRKTNRPRPSGCWTRPASPNISSVRL